MAEMPSKIGMYRVVRQLGEGGMGAVFEGVHETIERRVAIKVLHPEYARNAEFTARFFNEARAVNRIVHPGLVQISDYGQQPDGTSYIVMEYLDGESLAQRMERLGGKLPSPDVIHLGWQLADSLAAAHQKGIVHRDLKPENVMIVSDPQMSSGDRTKLLDFGIAKVTEEGGASRLKTKTNQVMGTPTYMSPEQCAGAGGVDDKSDVYSLGVMLFEMLAGRPPFVAEGSGQILGMHMFVAPPILPELVPDIPPPLAELVKRMLGKNKEARPTMRRTAETLEGLAEQQPRSKRSASSQALRPDDRESSHATLHIGRIDPKPSTLGSSAAQTLRGGPRLQQVGMALGVVLCVAGLGTFLTLRSMNRTSEHPLSKTVPSAQTITVPNKSVTLRIDSAPAGAQVLSIPDGQVLGQTPWQVTQMAADGRLHVRLRLDSYEEQELSLASSLDQHATVHLVPHRPTPAQTPSRSVEKPRPAPPQPSKVKTHVSASRIID